MDRNSTFILCGETFNHRRRINTWTVNKEKELGALNKVWSLHKPSLFLPPQWQIKMFGADNGGFSRKMVDCKHPRRLRGFCEEKKKQQIKRFNITGLGDGQSWNKRRSPHGSVTERRGDKHTIQMLNLNTANSIMISSVIQLFWKLFKYDRGSAWIRKHKT